MNGQHPVRIHTGLNNEDYTVISDRSIHPENERRSFRIA